MSTYEGLGEIIERLKEEMIYAYLIPQSLITKETHTTNMIEQTAESSNEVLNEVVIENISTEELDIERAERAAKEAEYQALGKERDERNLLAADLWTRGELYPTEYIVGLGLKKAVEDKFFTWISPDTETLGDVLHYRWDFEGGVNNSRLDLYYSPSGLSKVRRFFNGEIVLSFDLNLNPTRDRFSANKDTLTSTTNFHTSLLEFLLQYKVAALSVNSTLVAINLDSFLNHTRRKVEELKLGWIEPSVEEHDQGTLKITWTHKLAHDFSQLVVYYEVKGMSYSKRYFNGELVEEINPPYYPPKIGCKEYIDNLPEVDKPTYSLDTFGEQYFKMKDIIE